MSTETTTIQPATKPTAMGQLMLYVVGITLVVAAIAFYVVLSHRRSAAVANERSDRESEASKGPLVAVVVAKAAPPTRQMTVPGDVHAYRQVTVYAKVSGYLADLRVDRGDKVTLNEVLGVVTSPETDLQIAPLEATLATKQAIADRLKPLVPQGVATPQDLDRANADVSSARAEIERLRALRGYNEIRAPFAGVVTTRYVDRGALLSAATGSTQAAQPLVDIADMSRVRIIMYLGQREATLVKEGDSVSIVRDVDPTHPTVATVTRLPRELDPRTRTMPVEIEVANDGGLFYPGVFVNVTLTLAAPAGVLVPADSVFLRDTKPTVAVVQDGHAKFVTITIGDDDGKTARVLTGITAGEKIATHIGDEVSDGSIVQAVDAKVPPPPGAPTTPPAAGSLPPPAAAGSAPVVKPAPAVAPAGGTR